MPVRLRVPFKLPRSFLESKGGKLLASAEDPDPLQQGIKGLEEILEQFQDGNNTLRHIAATYCEVVKPDPTLHETWLPQLETILDHYVASGQEHLELCRTLRDEFERATHRPQALPIRNDLNAFTEKIGEVLTALTTLNETRLTCRKEMASIPTSDAESQQA